MFVPIAMNGSLRGALVAILTAAAVHAADSKATGGPSPDAPPPTVEQLFALPNVRQPKLSPDGKRIAFLFPHEKKMALGVFDRATKESRIILRGEDESIYSFFWKGDDRIVFEADVSGNESFFIGSTDLTGKNVLRIAESQRIEGNLTGDFAYIIDYLPGDPQRIAVLGYFAGNIDNSTFVGGALTVGRVNVRNRGLSPLFELRESDRYHPDDFIFDHTGALRLRARLEGHTIVWEHRPNDSASFKVIARHPYHGYAETWEPLAFAADDVTLWLFSREEHDRGALYAFNTQTLERGAPLFVPPEGEIRDPMARQHAVRAALYVSKDGNKLDGVAYESDRLHYHWFDPDRAATQAKLEATFKGCDVRITSTDEDRQIALVHVSHDREAGAYFVFDRKNGSLDLFKRAFEINPALLNPRRPITYKARDGLEIHGYLTLPRDSNGKNLPLIMHPHGGPFGIRDSWGFDRDAQFLASRGYAVLQPNYRGSGGYGREFINKGRQQWGRAMQDDLTDGVKWAIDQGIADPARIAIYGASYGGYATLMGVIGTPDLYVCGVNYVGASDLEITFHQRGEDAYRTGDEFSYRTEWVGPTRAYRAETSPINLVDRIKVPTLHAYGAEDPRVKIDHWSRLEPQLKKYGKPYERIVEGKQGHGFRDQDASIAFYKALDAFLAKHLRDRKPEVKIGQPKVTEMPAKK